ncbi:MAG: HlyD family efflux transporter periplasmic adaptor subunit [bacterium]|nr:HlyD family efflux transporter periplasmic adaptor subunit [bacterium]
MMPTPAWRARLVLASALLIGVTLSGCQKEQSAAAQTAPVAAVARGVIAVDGGLISIAAPRDGLIARVSVEEGAHVEQGAVLALLDQDRAALMADQAAAETAQLRAAWRGAQAKAAAARFEAERLTRPAAADAATRREAEQAGQAAAIAAAQSDEAGRAVDVARVHQRLAALEKSARTVRAPVAGVILRRIAAVGGAASPSSATPLFVLAPDGPRIVKAELDEAFVGKVVAGATASITDAAGGGPVFRARVVRLSPAVETALFDDPSSPRADGRVLTLSLAFDQPNDLRLGQRVLARINP